MTHPSGVPMRGPLASRQNGLRTSLIERGYSPTSTKNLVKVMTHLDQWLEAEGLSLQNLTRVRIEAYLEHRRACGCTCWLSPRGLEPILLYLRAEGVIPPPEPPPRDDSAPGRLLHEYETYLLEERSVTPKTASDYVRISGGFLGDLSLPEGIDLSGLSAEPIFRFVLREARNSGVGYARKKITAVRSFLRYVHVRGFCRDLTGAVPAVAGSRLAGLPKAIREEEVRRLLESCDPKTAVGRRDLAILLLLSRLGLRAYEVAALEIGDVGWARGEVRVRAKGAEGRLPLPQDVGEALVNYLRDGRPSSTYPGLFLNACAPYREISSDTVGAVVPRAAARAGLPRVTSHQLRHTAATGMLRKGASLSEVAHVLRHRSLDTTAIYAKVDRRALRILARRWPGGAR